MRLGRRPRCIGCRMRDDVCICHELKPIRARTQIQVLMHFEESYKPTNTGFLVQKVLPQTEILHWGAPGAPFDEAQLEGVVLFPSETARPIAPPLERLIVVDGTWRQTRRMMKRIPALGALPHVRLEPGPPSEFRIRRQHDPQGLSTLEAVARSLEVLGEPDVAAELMRVFRIMVDETIQMRGRPYDEARARARFRAPEDR